MILSKLKIHNCVFAGDRPPVESERWKGRETFYGSSSSITPLRNLSSYPPLRSLLLIPTVRGLLSILPWERLLSLRHLSSAASRWMPIVKGPVQDVQPLQKVCLVKVISSTRGTSRENQLAREASLKVLERGC